MKKSLYAVIALLVLAGAVFAINYSPSEGGQGMIFKQKTFNASPQAVVPVQQEIQRNVAINTTAIKEEALRDFKGILSGYLNTFANKYIERAWVVIDNDCINDRDAKRNLATYLNNIVMASSRMQADLRQFNDVNDVAGFRAIVDDHISTLNLSSNLANGIIESIPNECLTGYLKRQAFPQLSSRDGSYLVDLQRLRTKYDVIVGN